MRSFLIIVLLIISVISLRGQDCNKSNVNSFLEGIFKTGEYTSYDSTKFRGYSEKLEVITSPLLKKLLSDYCFFSTNFLSNEYEYLDVETVIAFSKNSNKKTIFIHSPVFTSESPDFLNLFYGLQLKDTIQSLQLAKEIMEIFSAITYKGRYDKLSNLTERSVISFELWHSDLSWRIFDFHFDNENILTRIKISGGVRRDAMKAGYRRQKSLHIN